MNLTDVMADKYTFQEIFDYILDKLREQNRPSVKVNTLRCMYRGDNGAKCAFGHLIPDEEYNPDMEGKFPVGLLEIMKIPNLYAGHKMIHFLSELQCAHDSSVRISFGGGGDDEPQTFIGRFERQMALIAGVYSLNYAPPSTEENTHEPA